jgi:hypothetical protein
MEPDKAAVGAGLALPEKGVENRGPENPFFIRILGKRRSISSTR